MPVYYIGAGVYNATLPVLATGERIDVQVDASGRVLPGDPHNNVTVFASAQRSSGANNSSDQTNLYCRGVRLYLDVTAVSGTSPTLDVKIQAKDPVSAKYFDIPGAAFAQKTGATTDDLTIYPGIAETANRSVSDLIPLTWRAVGTVGGSASPTVTFSLAAVMLR